MKKSILVFSLIAALISGCKTNQNANIVLERSDSLSSINQSSIQKIDSLVQSLIDNKIAAGASLGIQTAKLKPFLKPYGYANLSAGHKVKTNSQFKIASITKVFTATAIVQLIQSGNLLFDDTIDKFFPDFPNGDKITIYQLLSHTSGIRNWYETKMPDETPSDFPMCDDAHKYIEKMESLSLFEPGELFYYSNTGYALLDEIIEIISKKPYETFIRERILLPSGMTETEIERDYNIPDQWVKGYDYDKSLTSPFIHPEVYTPFHLSTYGFRSTPSDLLKFFKAFYSGKLISEEFRDKMTSYAKVNSGEDVDEDNFYFPSDFVRPTPPQYLTKYGHGLGFQRMDIYNSPAVWHAGGIAGFQSVVIYIPKNNSTIVLLTNTGNGGGYGAIWEDIQKIITEMNYE